MCNIQKIKRSTFAIMAISTFFGCTSKVLISGESSAGPLLKSDTTRQVSLMAKIQAKCNKVDSISTQIIKINPIGTGKSAASKKYGSVDERWSVSLCNKNIPYLVTFTPDGEGGTYFSTRLEK
ncbi:MAG: hypothetical protein PHV08_06135 [Sulfurovaceae bacterium]|nr:hypothetical protein [Sulfurovaceae bacterium]